MKHRYRVLLGLVLASMGAAASAGRHHICYEGPPDRLPGGQVMLKLVVGCADDSGAACWVTAVPPPAPPRGQLPVLPLNPTQPRNLSDWVEGVGSHWFFERQTGSGSPPGDTVMEVDIHFAKETRRCRVDARSTRSYSAAPDGVLAGFSTDASGLATTGVWRKTQAGDATTVLVPPDFVVVGGGVLAAGGALVTQARFDAFDDRRWSVATRDPSGKPVTQTTGYAIGLQIGGAQGQQALAGSLSLTSASSAAPVEDPVALVGLRPGEVALGAGVHAVTPVAPTVSNKRFATVSAPSPGTAWLQCLLLQQPCPPPQVLGWTAESKDDSAAPGGVSTQLRTLARKIVVDGQTWEVRGKLVQATSPVDTQPQTQVGGLRGEYAVTGVGATVNWRPFNRANPAAAGTRLMGIVPTFEQGGAVVQTGFGATQTVASVTGHALGIKLVPVGTPPEVEEPPHTELPMDVSWMCLVGGESLASSAMCLKYQGAVLRLGTVCKYFSDLPKFGYCKP